jgi:hypothetical protein
MESMREDAGQTGLFPTTEPQKMLKLLVLNHRSEKSTYVYNTSSLRNIHHHMHACPWKSSVFCFWLWSRTLVNLFLGFGFKNIVLINHMYYYYSYRWSLCWIFQIPILENQFIDTPFLTTILFIFCLPLLCFDLLHRIWIYCARKLM